MSKQEVDRILAADLKQLDQSVANKINNIQAATGSMDKKARFLMEFQKMMQQEMSNMKGNSVTPAKETNRVEEAPVTVEPVQHHPDNQALVQPPPDKQSEVKAEPLQANVPQKLKDVEQSPKRQSKQCLESMLVARTASHHQQPVKLCSRGRIRQRLSLVMNQIKKAKNQIPIMKEDLEAMFKSQHDELAKHLWANYPTIQTHRQSTDPSQLKELKGEVNWLKNQLKSLSEKVAQSTENQPVIHQPLKQVTFKELVKDNLPAIFSKSNKKCEPQLFLDQPSPIRGRPDDFSYNVTSQNTSRVQMHAPNLTQGYSNVPAVRIISVGMPPVRDGFGILREGNHVVYKGMWRNGRFDGKGKLSWEGFTYEGDFKGGCFEGYGTLKWANCEFMGRFQRHSAQGEGTLSLGTHKFSGFWRDNALLQQLQS